MSDDVTSDARPAPAEVTRLLRDWRGGDQGALQPLANLLYADLRRRAVHYLASERAGQSWQPTDLVHESFLRLVDADVSWQDRAHFLAVASRTMRRLLVDRARARGRQKRRPPGVAVNDPELAPASAGAPPVDLLDLDSALQELEAMDAPKARILELRFFGGLTVREIAEVVERSRSAVDREIQFSKAWLHRRLSA